MRDDSAEILFQSFLQEALVSSSGMGKDVISLTLSIQHFLRRPRRHPSSDVPRGMILERLPWCLTCRNHVSFRLSTVARKRSCGPARTPILLHTQSLVLSVQVEDAEKFPQARGLESLQPLLRVCKQGPRLTAVEEEGDDKETCTT